MSTAPRKTSKPLCALMRSKCNSVVVTPSVAQRLITLNSRHQVTSRFTQQWVLIRCPTASVVEKEQRIVGDSSSYTSLIEQYLDLLICERTLACS